MNDKQLIAFEIVEEHYNKFHNPTNKNRKKQGKNDQLFLEITGKPGVGKSFLIDSFRDLIGPNLTIVCQTGKAAVNVKGSTINKTFGLPINMFH